jgi:hypothetical protein
VVSFIEFGTLCRPRGVNPAVPLGFRLPAIEGPRSQFERSDPVLPLYIVKKDQELCGATFDEQEACSIFDSFVHSGKYQDVSVVIVPAFEDNCRVLLAACQRR